MSFKSTVLAALLAATTALPAFAADIMISDAYVRTSMKGAKSGAAFMQIVNNGGVDDRLIDARSAIAKKVELHTHKEQGDGVMRMVHVEEGFAIPAGATHMLQRGGDHVMFMGLLEDLGEGDSVEVTLTFEQAGDITVQIPFGESNAGMMGGAMHKGHGMKDGSGMKPSGHGKAAGQGAGN